MDAALPGPPQRVWRQARTWGWPLAAGIAGLAAAAVVSLVAVPRVRRESQDVAADADRAARRALHAAGGAQDARRTESAPEHFRAAFPGVDARQSRVAALLELAARHSLALHRSEFQLSRDKGSGLLRYSVTMPLAGTYAQLRGFVEEALAADAALSLDRMRLRRTSPGAPDIEADLTWSFYMRPAGAPASGAAR
jgi:hypothetical protein